MALRFNKVRRPQNTRGMVPSVPLRLVSLVVGLAMVVVLMQMVESSSTREKLALLFGDARPVVDITEAELPPTSLEGIDTTLLAEVEDNTPFRNEETEAWFHLIGIARDTPDELLESASLGPIVYAQLISQPKVYRGRVIEITGRARRIESFKPADNDLGIDQYFRVIIQPDRDALRPFTLYCLELPEGWAPGESLPNDGELRVEALFFKNWPHNTGEDKLSLSPTFVSRTVTAIAYVTPPIRGETSRPAWQVILLAAVVAGLAVAWIVYSRGTPDRSKYVASDTEIAEQLSGLELPKEQQE